MTILATLFFAMSLLALAAARSVHKSDERITEALTRKHMELIGLIQRQEQGHQAQPN